MLLVTWISKLRFATSSRETWQGVLLYTFDNLYVLCSVMILLTMSLTYLNVNKDFPNLTS